MKLHILSILATAGIAVLACTLIHRGSEAASSPNIPSERVQAAERGSTQLGPSGDQSTLGREVKRLREELAEERNAREMVEKEASQLRVDLAGLRPIHSIEEYSVGRKKAEGDMVGGLREGVWTLWRDNGVLESRGEYIHGKRQGQWEFYDAHGDLSAKGTCVNDVREGLWTFRQSDGNMGSARYVAGEVVQDR